MSERILTDRRTFLTACSSASFSVLAGIPPGVLARQRESEEIRLDYIVNPLGPSPRAMEKMQKSIHCVHQYPDFYCKKIRKVIAERNKLTHEHVVMGNGSCEVIQQAVLALLGPGKVLITGKPDFFIPGFLAKKIGADVLAVPVAEDYRLDLKTMASEVRRNTGLFYLCNPLNPLGTYIPWKELKRLIDSLPSSLPILIDEAYHELMTVPDYESAIQLVREDRPNTIVTRTFSKAYGLAGLRIGYGLAAPELAHRMRRRATPVGRTLLAQIAAIAAYNDQKHVQKTKQMLKAAKAFTVGEFRRLKIDYIASEAPYTVFRVGNPKLVCQKLKKKEYLYIQSHRNFQL
jgi:histidinol-phosphate aminotransferase